MKQYCIKKPYSFFSCEVGWGQMSCGAHGEAYKIKTCFDEPIEENCRNLIKNEELTNKKEDLK